MIIILIYFFFPPRASYSGTSADIDGSDSGDDLNYCRAQYNSRKKKYNGEKTNTIKGRKSEKSPPHFSILMDLVAYEITTMSSASSFTVKTKTAKKKRGRADLQHNSSANGSS